MGNVLLEGSTYSVTMKDGKNFVAMDFYPPDEGLIRFVIEVKEDKASREMVERARYVPINSIASIEGFECWEEDDDDEDEDLDYEDEPEEEIEMSREE